MMSDVEIRDFIRSKEIVIKPFDEKCLEPASYDCCVRRVLLAGRGIVDPKKERIILRTGDWVEIESLEEFELGLGVAATIGIRSSITRKGIDWFAGPQLDPGFNGRVYVSLFNPSSESCEIKPDEPLFTMIFHKLGKPASRGYGGKYQGRKEFPEEDIQRMTKMQSPTLADVVVSVGVLESTVGKLTKATEGMAKDIGWVKYLLTGILIALVVGLAIGLPLALLNG